MSEKQREALTKIFQAGLAAVDPEAAVKRHLVRDGETLYAGGVRFDLSRLGRVVCCGVGKGTAPMAKAVEDVLGERLSGGLIIVKYGHGLPLARIRVREAGHPVPDEAGERAASELIALLETLGEDDLAILCISGGGSALLPAPAPPVTLPDKQETTRLLLACGATIHEMNAIRKHLSRGKGGGLARAAAPAAVVSLVLSDVVGDPLDVIASGPAVPDTSTFGDCLEITNRHGITGDLPNAVRERLEAGAVGRIAETPKPGDPIFSRVANVIVASNRECLRAASEEAARLGYAPVVLTSLIEGEAREVAKVLCAIAREAACSGNPGKPPLAVLAGGEPTVTLRGNGKGGRNQELALAAALAIAGESRIALLSAGTDGTDGPTDAAGGFAFGDTRARAKSLGLDPRHFLGANDAYHFLQALGDLLVTGPTRTNVMDMICLLVD